MITRLYIDTGNGDFDVKGATTIPGTFDFFLDYNGDLHEALEYLISQENQDELAKELLESAIKRSSEYDGKFFGHDYGNYALVAHPIKKVPETKRYFLEWIDGVGNYSSGRFSMEEIQEILNFREEPLEYDVFDFDEEDPVYQNRGLLKLRSTDRLLMFRHPSEFVAFTEACATLSKKIEIKNDNTGK